MVGYVKGQMLFGLSASIVTGLLPAQGAEPVGTAFTYQGQLKQDGVPLSDTCDFEFTLWDEAGVGDPPAGGDQIGSAHRVTTVTNGLFTVEPPLDFGPAAFDGQARWLQMAVRCPADADPPGTYSTFSPRQQLTPAPYALRAVEGVGPPNAIEVDGATGAVGIGTSSPLSGAKLSIISQDQNLLRGMIFSSVNSPFDGEHRILTARKLDLAGSTRFDWTLQTAGDEPELQIVHTERPIGGTVTGGYGLTMSWNGKVGIGRNNPQAALDVGGIPNVDGIRFPDGSLQTTAAVGGDGGGSTQFANVLDFGAVGDGQADDTEAIEKAIRAGRATIYFPRFLTGVGYRATRTIEIPAGIAVHMDAPIVCDCGAQMTCLKLGEEGVSNRLLYHRLNVRNKELSDWSVENSIGIQIHNAAFSRLDVTQAEGFTIGVQCISSGEGFVYNQVHLGLLASNKIALDLTNRSVNGQRGWCNENVFLNGQFTTWTNVHPSLSRYGIRITSQDGGYVFNNNNLFIKPSFELVPTDDRETVPEAVPILIEHGRGNAFLSCRDDGNSTATTTVFARVLNESSENEFEVGVWGAQQPVVDDRSRFPGSRARSRQFRLANDPGAVLFLSGPIHERASYYDGDTSVHVPGMFTVRSNSADTFVASSAISIHQDYLEVPGSRGVGVFIDTSRLKRFVVRKGVVPGYGGRVYIRCYDSAGEVLTDPDDENLYVSGYPSRRAWFDSTTFGGAYLEGSDSELDWYFRVTEQVKRIALFIAGGTEPCRLSGFSVFSVDGGKASVWAGYEEGIPGANLGTGPPSAGTWERGRMILNAEPAAGEPFGWICVASGTPGDWKPLATLGP